MGRSDLAPADGSEALPERCVTCWVPWPLGDTVATSTPAARGVKSAPRFFQAFSPLQPAWLKTLKPIDLHGHVIPCGA